MTYTASDIRIDTAGGIAHRRPDWTYENLLPRIWTDETGRRWLHGAGDDLEVTHDWHTDRLTQIVADRLNA